MQNTTLESSLFVYLHYNPAGVDAISSDVKENARVSHIFTWLQSFLKK